MNNSELFPRAFVAKRALLPFFIGMGSETAVGTLYSSGNAKKVISFPSALLLSPQLQISFLSLFPHFIFLSSVYDLISTPTPFLYFPSTRGESGG